MTIVYILLIVCIILAATSIVVVVRFAKHMQSADRTQAMTQQITDLGMQQAQLRTAMENNLERIHRAGADQFREAREVIGDITRRSDRLVDQLNRRLGDLDKTNQRIADFSGQLYELQKVLRNPKQRGVMGEFILEHVLGNVLPPDTYKMQYGFRDGEIVDAAVFVKDKVIPVDAKFSLENYERMMQADGADDVGTRSAQFRADVKKRIDETAKYVRPEENTTDFAFMFIPSEAVYYDLLANSVGENNMIEYAFRDRRVVIVSPTSFLAYLQTVVQGLRALEIEENAKHIKVRVEQLSRHWNQFETYVAKMGKSLQTTVNHYNAAHGELGKVDRDVMRITDRTEPSFTVEKVERPILD